MTIPHDLIFSSSFDNLPHGEQVFTIQPFDGGIFHSLPVDQPSELNHDVFTHSDAFHSGELNHDVFSHSNTFHDSGELIHHIVDHNHNLENHHATANHESGIDHHRAVHHTVEHTDTSHDNFDDAAELTPIEFHPPMRANVFIIDSFLNDIITFNLDDRFSEKSLFKLSNIGSEILRDISKYVVVNPNISDHNLYKVLMISPLFDRHKVKSKINKSFSEFV